jgi:hypothetical protein
MMADPVGLRGPAEFIAKTPTTKATAPPTALTNFTLALHMYHAAKIEFLTSEPDAAFRLLSSTAIKNSWALLFESNEKKHCHSSQ